MQVLGGPRISVWMKAVLRVLVAATFAEIGIFLGLVVLHSLSPTTALLTMADAAGVSLGLTGTVTLLFATAYALVAFPSFRIPVLFLALLVGATLMGHLYIISNPSLPDCRDAGKNVNGCVMDEVYYVPTAENMLNGTQCGQTIPNCNTEHPFLSKALISAGIALFGDNSFGWRIFNVLLGTFSLPLIFALTLKVSGDRRLAYLSTILLAVDVMFFTQSSAALIDIPGVFFGLAAFVVYAFEAKWWVLNRYALSGVLMGLAILSKETGIFLAFALAAYHFVTSGSGEALSSANNPRNERLARHVFMASRLFGVGLVAVLVGMALTMIIGPSVGQGQSSQLFRLLTYAAVGLALPFVALEATSLRLDRPDLSRRLFESVAILLVSAGVVIAGLQAYDSLFARSAFPLFVDQLKYMLSYGSSLIGPGWSWGNGIQITPFSWMTYYQPVVYYGTSVSVCTDSVNGVCQSAQLVFPGVAYYGITNLLETWTTYIWFPLAIFAIWKAYGPAKKGLERFGFADPDRRRLSGGDKAGLLALIWFSFNYFPYILLYGLGRVTYPFYFIPAIPAVAIGSSYFLTRKWVPTYTQLLYLGGAFALLFIFFPSKAFLPDWIRAIIGR